MHKPIFLMAWLALILHWAFFSPPPHPTIDHALWAGVLTMNFGAIDPAVVCVFLLLGLTADLFVVFLLRDGRFQPLPGWPFGLLSFGLGSFVVVPYLLLRSKNPPPAPPAPRITRILSSRPVGALIVVGIVAVLGYAFARGTVDGFLHAYRSSMLVHVMSLDFLLVLAILAFLVEEARRLDPPVHEPFVARAIRFVPLLGPALWSALVSRDA